MYRPGFVLLLVLACFPASARAGIYYSGEKYATLPAQWRGFLLDQRLLRNIAVAAPPGGDVSPLRARYLEEANKLRQRAEKEKLGADEWSDLGALLIRLGDAAHAAEFLRSAQQEHPTHFQIAANLGTAWQLLGEMERALDCLKQAVQLAPGRDLPFEEAHFHLVQMRMRQRRTAGELDDLFGVHYVGPGGSFEVGKLAEAERKKLPARAVAIVQQLALWLPADGPLLWQLAELAAAHGDVRSAAAMMDGCVIQFGMQNPKLREHRRQLRVAADALPKLEPGAKVEHEPGHAGSLAFRSRRPLISKLDLPLPAISDGGVNHAPWELFGETVLEQPFHPTFPKYLRDLQGKQVELTGFLIPVRDEPDAGAFMFVEAPVGCWYCEMPELTGIVYVEMPRGRTARYQRGLLRVVGRLTLNSTDPEDFLYTVRDARIGAVD
jgi:tetratricopeptide (TPR) repeat protein